MLVCKKGFGPIDRFLVYIVCFCIFLGNFFEPEYFADIVVGFLGFIAQFNQGKLFKWILYVDDGLGHILELYFLVFVKLVNLSVLCEFWSVRNCCKSSEVAFLVLHPDFKALFTAIERDFDPAILLFQVLSSFTSFKDNFSFLKNALNSILNLAEKVSVLKRCLSMLIA